MWGWLRRLLWNLASPKPVEFPGAIWLSLAIGHMASLSLKLPAPSLFWARVWTAQVVARAPTKGRHKASPRASPKASPKEKGRVKWPKPSQKAKRRGNGKADRPEHYVQKFCNSSHFYVLLALWGLAVRIHIMSRAVQIAHAEFLW